MSVQTEMLEIREFDKDSVSAGCTVEKRIVLLNNKFEDWVFTKQSRTDKIEANRIDDLYGNPIEV